MAQQHGWGAMVAVAALLGCQVEAEGPQVDTRDVPAGPLDCADFDLDDDGVIGFGDFAFLSNNFNETTDDCVLTKGELDEWMEDHFITADIRSSDRNDTTAGQPYPAVANPPLDCQGG